MIVARSDLSRRVLMLSAHSFQLDRRITAEADTLAQAGYEVTILSVPVRMSNNDVPPSVGLVMPDGAAPVAGNRRRLLKRVLAGALPGRLYDSLRAVKNSLLPGDPTHVDFFLEHLPEGSWHFIHCHDLDTLKAGMEIRNRCANDAKVVYDSHELFPYQTADPRSRHYWQTLEADLIHHCDAVITVNPSCAGHMARSYGIDAPMVMYNSHYVTLPETVSQDEFLAHFDAPGDGFRVMFQGSLTPGRNLENLVAAFGPGDGSARLFVLGAGPLERRLRRGALRRGARVHFGGWVEQKRLAGFTSHAHLGVIPYDGSKLENNRYCTPNKLFEFIEALVPVCSAKLPEVSRIVETASVGAAYQMSGPADIAAAVEDCRRRCLAGEFHDSARRAARERYGWRRQAEKLLELYRNLGD